MKKLAACILFALSPQAICGIVSKGTLIHVSRQGYRLPATYNNLFLGENRLAAQLKPGDHVIGIMGSSSIFMEGYITSREDITTRAVEIFTANGGIRCSSSTYIWNGTIWRKAHTYRVGDIIHRRTIGHEMVSVKVNLGVKSMVKIKTAPVVHFFANEFVIRQ